MQVMKGRFTAVIEAAEEGGFWAYCPEIAGANGQGDTQEEAEATLNQAIQLLLESQALEEAPWMFEAARLGVATPESIIAWSDAKVMDLDRPPFFLIELSTLRSSDSRNYASVIQAHVPETLDAEQRISLVVTAFDQQVIDLDEALPILFRLWLPLPPEKPTSGIPEHVADLLAEWDIISDVEPLPEDFVSRCMTVFAHHREQHGSPPSAIFHLPSTISSC
ncbi:type II toxin-antitoxin system HicB family antitoxin [Luteolibacter sp. GHJ8]|uniref:Type II toxin-antitoxin system HicB family antitoxin n=1 Tax=Luteolibacter rhizosphaerae TaxID=2989719 RepID=A0ABT3G6B7_9BACT|nr:type II toxin-antitoxin system HicB family antitoxin [Luteolibacter rhizosphaerae]